jgi:hypothetical protein
MSGSSLENSIWNKTLKQTWGSSHFTSSPLISFWDTVKGAFLPA